MLGLERHHVQAWVGAKVLRYCCAFQCSYSLAACDGGKQRFPVNQYCRLFIFMNVSDYISEGEESVQLA